MPRRRPRPQRGERRIDVAIDHFAKYGFAEPQIRKVIEDLLQLYGRDGWVFLEERSYLIVLNKLLEEQAQQDPEEGVVIDPDAVNEDGGEP